VHVEPTSKQVEAFAAAATERAEPVFMLNLLRFAEDAGAEAYGRYAAAVGGHLDRVGGAIVWAGACDAALIGPDDPEWHAAAVVRYPSRSAFLEMVSDPEYLEVASDRSAGLADSRLIPCDASSPAPGSGGLRSGSN